MRLPNINCKFYTQPFGKCIKKPKVCFGLAHATCILLGYHIIHRCDLQEEWERPPAPPLPQPPKKVPLIEGKMRGSRGMYNPGEVYDSNNLDNSGVKWIKPEQFTKQDMIKEDADTFIDNWIKKEKGKMIMDKEEYKIKVVVEGEAGTNFEIVSNDKWVYESIPEALEHIGCQITADKEKIFEELHSKVKVQLGERCPVTFNKESVEDVAELRRLRDFLNKAVGRWDDTK